jgi:hypothetical protein
MSCISARALHVDYPNNSRGHESEPVLKLGSFDLEVLLRVDPEERADGLVFVS